jgi:threonyl-tRNA synthetase
MIHQAVLGSIERFMAILLEHHRGNLPFWVVPEQIVITPVSVGQLEYARATAEIFHSAGLRCITDEANESLSRRIVAAHNKGIPIFVTVGPKEVSAGTVTIRERGGGLSVRSLSEATDWLKAMNASD